MPTSGPEKNQLKAELTLKLFSHINNDAHLVGTRTLEGERFIHTVGFLNRFIDDIKSKNDKIHFPPEILAKSKIELLSNKLGEMIDVELAMYGSLLSTLEILPEEQRDRAYIDFTAKTAENITALANEKSDQSVFFPGGWQGATQTNPGHAMVYEFRKDEEGNVIFLIYNSGNGLQYHKRTSDVDKDRYVPIKAYKIPKEMATKENINFFLGELVKPRVEALLPDVDITRNRLQTAEKLYTQVFPKIAFIGGQEIDPRDFDVKLGEIITMGQRSGTCAEHCLHELIKSIMPDDNSAQLFIFHLKKYSIEKYLEEKNNHLDAKDREEINLAIENFARIIEKNPGLFSKEEIIENFNFIKNVKNIMDSYQLSTSTHHLSLNSLDETKNIFSQAEGKMAPPLQAIELGSDVSSSKFPEKHSVESLLTPPFSNEKFSDFLGHINKLNQKNKHEEIVETIEALLLQLPLEKKHYSTIDSTEQANELIKNLSALLRLYSVSCQMIDPMEVMGPKRVISLLSALSMMSIITQKEGIALSDQGLNSVMGRQFYDLVHSLHANPFLGTGDPILDQRLSQIRNNELPPPTNKKEAPPDKFNKISVYTDYINKHPHGVELRKALNELFNEKAITLFDSDEIGIIKEKNLAAEIALMLLGDHAPSNLAEEVAKAKFDKSVELLSSNVMLALNSFKYNALAGAQRLINGGSIYIEKDGQNSKFKNIEYNSVLHDFICIHSKLAQYGPPIKNKSVQASLQGDLGSNVHPVTFQRYGDSFKSLRTRMYDPNVIQCSPHGVELPSHEQSQLKSHFSKEDVFNKMMLHLRTDPASQVITSIEFFDSHLDLLNDKDYQIYLEKNLFQPGLLIEGLKKNSLLFNKINNFINAGITYHNQSGKITPAAIYFQKLQFTFNQYVASCDLSQYHAEAKEILLLLNKAIPEIELANLPLDAQQELTVTHLNNQRFLLQQNLIPVNEQSLLKFFDGYLAYKKVFNQQNHYTAEMINENRKIDIFFVNIFHQHKTQIPALISTWCLHNKIDLTPFSPLSWEDYFPNFIAKDKDNNMVLNVDIMTGDISLKGEKLVSLPATLIEDPLYKKFSSKGIRVAAQIFVTYPESKTVYQRFKISDQGTDSYYYETPFSDKPYSYHHQKNINGKRNWYELQTLASNDEKEDKQTSTLGAKKAKFTLPNSFFCESTSYWQSTDMSHALVQREDKNYLLDTNGEIYELDSQGNNTGYTLLNLQKEKSTPNLDNIFDLFSHFEDKSFIEILVKQNGESTGPEIKIYFPRYDLELHGFQDATKKWHIFPKDQPSLELKQDQTHSLTFKGPLIFEDKAHDEDLAFVPYQEFYVEKSSIKKGTSFDFHSALPKNFSSEAEAQNTTAQQDVIKEKPETQYQHVYYDFSFDTHHEVKRELIGENNAEDKDQKPGVTQNKNVKAAIPAGPWQYVKKETFFSYSIDKKTGEFKSSDNTQGLYLAYLQLCQLHPEKALNELMKIINAGGIKGTQSELALIEKIIHGVPRYPDKAKIKNPQFISVKMHALSLIAHYHAKGNKITLSPQTPTTANSKSEHFQNIENTRLMKFYTNINEDIQDVLYDYHHTRRNIPLRMRLSTNQEYEMLNLLQHDDETLSPSLKARYIDLKKEFLAKEKAYIKSSGKLGSSLQARQEVIDSKIEKPKDILILQTDVRKTFFPVQTSKTFVSFSEELPTEEVMKLLAKKTSAFALPHLGIRDRAFINQFLNYYDLARAPGSSKEKIQLKDFCEKAVLSTVHQGKDSKTSLIPELAGVLLKVIEHPEVFKEIPLDNFNANLFMMEIYATAHSIPLYVSTTAIERDNATITYQAPTSLKDIPIVEKISSGPFSYPQHSNDSYLQQAKLTEFISQYESKRTLLEKNIAELIKKEFPANMSYEKSAAIISKLDRKIGEMRNNFEQTIEHLAISHLASPQIISHLLSVTNKCITNIQSDLGGMEENLCELANRGPQDIQGKLAFDLQHFGQTRAKLEMKDLYRLYVLADKNEYKKITGLDDADIIQLHQKICDYIQLSILAQTHQARKNALQKCQSLSKEDPGYQKAFIELGSILAKKNIADVSSEPEIQFFQMEEGILVYPLQKYYLDKLLKRDETTLKFVNEIIQLYMGGGKSKVIGPLSALKKANGTNLVIQQVKSSLFNSHYADANATSLRLFGQEAIPFLFERNSPCDSKACKKIYDNFHKCIVNKNYLVTTGDSLAALELKYLELLFSPPQTDTLHFKEWKKQIKWLDRSLQLIKYRGDRNIDELHEEGDPNKILNFTLGAPSNIPLEDIQLEIDLFEYFAKINISSIVDKEATTLLDLILNNKLAQSPEQWEKIFFEAAKTLVMDSASPIGHIVAKLNLTENQVQQLIDYLLNKSDDILDKFGILTEREKDKVAFVKCQIAEILPFTLQKNMHENYGPTWRKTATVLQKMAPIPYKANNSPNERARFGHIIEYMNYAVQMINQTPITKELIEEIINDYIEQAKSEMLESPELTFERTLANISFNQLFEKENLSLEMLAKKNPEYNAKAISTLQRSSAFKKFCLKNYVLPQIKINPMVLSSNPQNCMSMTNTNQGMTGTPSNFRAMHQDFTFNVQESLGTDGETIDLIKKNGTKVELIDHYETPTALLGEMWTKVPEKDRIRAIIDVGALFRGIPNDKIAEEIADFYLDKGIDSIKFVLYYNNYSDTLYALNVKTREKIEINSTNESVISEKLKCSPYERFTFYDQARAVGTDIRQDAKAHAILTINEKTVKDAATQGYKRMRDKQTETIVGPSYMKAHFNSLTPEIDMVIDLLEVNQYKKNLKAHMRGTQQKFHNIVRENLLQKIYAQKDPIKKAQYAELFKEFFTSQYQPTHFKNAGQIIAKQNTESYLEDLATNYYDAWINLCKKNGIDISTMENATVKQSFSKVKNQGIEACAMLTEQRVKKGKATDIPMQEVIQELTLGTEVEIQNEIETELENELENETEEELELEHQQYMYDPNSWVSDAANFTFNQGIIHKPGYLYSMNDALNSAKTKPTFTLSSNIHMTTQFAKSHREQMEYFGVYTKPIEVILMVVSKNPPHHFDAIVMTKKEAADFHMLSKEERESRYPKHHLWTVTPQNTVIWGDPPAQVPKSYASTLEQIKYMNGDCKLLALQREPLIWFNDKTDEKLQFFVRNILPIHPEQACYYKRFTARVDVMNKILRQIIDNPTQDFTQENWIKRYPGFKKLSENKKRSIQKLAQAYHTMHIASADFFEESKFKHWLKQFPDDIIPLINLRSDMFKVPLKAKEAMKQHLPLSQALQNEKKFKIDFNFLNDAGQTPLQYVLLERRIEDLNFVLEHSAQLNALDAKGKSTYEYLLDVAEHDENFGILATQKFMLQGLDVTNMDEQPNLFDFAVEKNAVSILETILSSAILQGKSIKEMAPIISRNANRSSNPRIKALLSENNINNMQKRFQLCQNLETMLAKKQLLPSLYEDPYSALTDTDIKLYKGGNILLRGIFEEQFMQAIKDGNIKIVLNFLQRGINVNFESAEGFTPLMYAAKLGNKEMVTFLLDHGANIKMGAKRQVGFIDPNEIMKAQFFTEPEIKTVLLLMVEYEPNEEIKKVHNEIAAQLLLAWMTTLTPANVDEPDAYGITPLMWACQLGNETLVTKLLSMGANPNRTDMSGAAPLIFACSQNNLQIVSKLIDAGASIHPKTNEGETALYMAAMCGQKEIAQHLIKLGADVNVCNRQGSSMLWLYDVETAAVLIDGGVDINQPNNAGDTPLMNAVSCGNTPLIELLLSKGVDVNHINSHGKTALEMARDYCFHNPDVVKLLEEHVKKTEKQKSSSNQTRTSLIFSTKESSQSYELEKSIDHDIKISPAVSVSEQTSKKDDSDKQFKA